MTDKPAAPEFASARASLRDTVKWLVGVGAALGAALAAGISFTALGKLDGPALGMALVMGLVALSALILALNGLLGVMLVQPFTITELLKDQPLCDRIADTGTLPDGAETLPKLLAKRQQCVDALRKSPKDAQAEAVLAVCNTEIAKAMDLAAFMDLSDHTRRAIRHLALWSVVICLSTAAIGLLIGQAGDNDGAKTAAAGPEGASECVVTFASAGTGPPGVSTPLTIALPAGCAETRIVLSAAAGNIR